MRSFRAVSVTSLLAFPALIISAYSHAQDVSGEPLNGTVTLTSGFVPDPHVVNIVPGGDTAVSDLGAGCTGYIFAAQPDLRLVLETAGTWLGIFVSADIDTTLVINDPSGAWHCNDDHSDLGASNPGVEFPDVASGTYDIWVGTYSDVGVGGNARLAITEYTSTGWTALDLGGSATVVKAPAESFNNNQQNNYPQDSVQPMSTAGVYFGDDGSSWANDGECDDPRFYGNGMATTALEEDMHHDASDCEQLMASGEIEYSGEAVTSTTDEDDSEFTEAFSEALNALIDANTEESSGAGYTEDDYAVEDYTDESYPEEDDYSDEDYTDADEYADSGPDNYPPLSDSNTPAPDYSDSSRVIASDGVSAMDCAQLVDIAPGNSNTTGLGNRVIANNCGETIEITWCYVGEGDGCGGGGLWTVGAGGSWPVDRIKEIRWAACRGRNSVGFEQGSYGLRYICSAPY